MLEFKGLKKADGTDAQENDINSSNFASSNIYVQKTGIQTLESSLSFNPAKSIDKLNFYCFSDSNVDNAEELNFNNLKKCQKTDYVNLTKKDKQRFLVVDFDNIVENQNTNIQKTIQYWHNKDMELVMTLVSGSCIITFDSTIKSILHKGFTLPTTST